MRVLYVSQTLVDPARVSRAERLAA